MRPTQHGSRSFERGAMVRDTSFNLNKSGDSLITGLDDAEWELVQERSDQAFADFRNSARPIYARSLRDPRPEQIGSCVLLDVDGTRVVSTAAHIVDELALTDLFVCGLVRSQLVPMLGGKVRATKPPPGGNRRLDHLDCAFWQIPDSSIQGLGEVEFLNASMFSHNRARQCRIATTWRWVSQYHVTRKPSKNSRSPIDGLDTPVPWWTGQSWLLRWGCPALNIYFCSSESMRLRPTEAINTFGPKGLSGGALLDLGDFTGPAIYSQDKRRSARLSGMLIEHYEDHHAVVAVKIGPIVNGIRRSLARNKGSSQGGLLRGSTAH